MDRTNFMSRIGQPAHVSEALKVALADLPFATVPHAQERIRTLRAEVIAAEQKLERLRGSLAVRRQKLNRLLAEAALSGSATVHHDAH